MVFLFFITCVFSISLYAKSVSFTSLSKNIESTNPSIIYSRLQTLLTNEEIKSAKSNLYPKLTLSANSEYTKKYIDTRSYYIIYK